ncbi:MAG: ribbon-helix-helix protein, CopG family [Candidatus Bathyarchaeota archaeon]|nr:ribbon-helix-helix protein, CopG family [Candidatus Bathyarchaeota archaeon]
MDVINVRLPKNVVQDLEKLAKRHDLTRSEVIRQALIVYIHFVENVGTLLRPTLFRVKPAQISYVTRGDVSVMKMPTGHAIVVGSSSSGGVGPKPMDKIKSSGKIVGKFLARVASMDVAATGAFPVSVSVTLGVEKEPTGNQIIEGIQKEIKGLGLEPNQVLKENTEENFETIQTGAGITVVGLANEDELRLAKTAPGDLVVAIGEPKLGDEVIPAEVRGEIANLKDVTALARKKFVHDIVPVGSFGISHEAKMLAYSIGRQLKIDENTKLDLNKSAGPATVVLTTLNKENLGELQFFIQKPINVIGEIL